MSRVLCFKAQAANCSFRLSWATSAIRFRLGIGGVNGCGDRVSGLRTPESPLHPTSVTRSKVTLSERFGSIPGCTDYKQILASKLQKFRIYLLSFLNSGATR